MKKWIFFLLILFPTTGRAAGAGGINLTPDPRAILKTTSTALFPWTFQSSVTFVSPLMMINGVPYSWPNANAVGCFKNDGNGNISFGACGSGSGGSGGSGVYLGPPYNVSVSTLMLPEFNIISDGNGASTATIRNSTGIYTAAQTFTRLVIFSSDTFSVGITSGSGIFTSTAGFVGGSSTMTSYAFTPRFGAAFTGFTKPDNADTMDVISNNLRLMTLSGTNITMNTGKQILGTGGTIAAPDFSSVLDQGAGLVIFNAAPTRGALTALGKDRLRWTSNGQVTIGGIGRGSHGLYVSSASLPNQGILAAGSETLKFDVWGASTAIYNDLFAIGKSTFMGTIYTTATVQIGGVDLTVYMSTTTQAIAAMAGGGSGGSGFHLGPPWNVNVATAMFPNTDFNVRSDGVGSSSFTWRDSTGIVSATQIFVGSNVFIRINQTPAGLEPTILQFTYGGGDNTTFKGVIGIQSIVADHPSVTSLTKGVLYAAEYEVQPSIDRNNVPFDDAVPLVLANGGAGKATDGLYFSKNALFNNKSQWLSVITIDANSDIGLKENASYYIGVQMDNSTYSIAPITLPWNSYIAAKSKADSSYKNLIGYNLNEKVSLRDDAITIDGSSQTNIMNLTVPSTFTIIGATVTVGPNKYWVFPASGCLQGQHLMVTSVVGNYQYFACGGDALGSGSGGNTTWYYVNQATAPLFMNGYSIMGTSQVLVNASSGAPVEILVIDSGSAIIPQYTGAAPIRVPGHFKFADTIVPSGNGIITGVEGGYIFEGFTNIPGAGSQFLVVQSLNGIQTCDSGALNYGALSDCIGGTYIGQYMGTGSHPSTGGSSHVGKRLGTGNVTTLYGAKGQLTDSGGGGTISNAFTFYALRPTISAGGTATRTAQFFASSANATSGNQTNTPYGFYSEGSANFNYFAGAVGIGSAAATPSSLLYVTDGGITVLGKNANLSVGTTQGALLNISSASTGVNTWFASISSGGAPGTDRIVDIFRDSTTFNQSTVAVNTLVLNSTGASQTNQGMVFNFNNDASRNGDVSILGGAASNSQGFIFSTRADREQVGIGTNTTVAKLTVYNSAPSSGNYTAVFTTAPPTSGFYTVGITTNGHITTQGGTPIITSCGTSPNGVAVGDDISMTVTVGGTATGCVITFSSPYVNTPACTVTNQSMSITSPMSYSKTNAAITISQAVGLSGDLLDINCIGLKQ